ncbi:glycosyltransferase [Halorubrum coriense]|nr:glycosyltransferase [Halorubrum coriense]
MVRNPDREDGTFEMYLAKIIESLTVRFANRVIWMDGIQMQKKYFIETYPNLAEKQFKELPFLGFEAGKFESVPTENYEASTITYAGSFYEGWIEPYELLRGFSDYVNKNEPEGDELTLQFYGDWSDEYQGAVEKLNLVEFVNTYNFVPHEKIIPLLKGSDIVVYIGGKDPENRLSVPSKIWDYMGAKTPILAVVDPSFRVAQLIEENGLGVVVHPDNREEIADAIERMLSGEFQYVSNKTTFDEFSRSHKMDELAEVLDSVSENNH